MLGISENSWCWGPVRTVGVGGQCGQLVLGVSENSWCWGSVRTVGVGGQ